MTFTFDGFRKPFQGNLTDKVNFVCTFGMWVIMSTYTVLALRSTFIPVNGVHWTEWAIGVVSAIIAFSIRFKPPKNHE